MYWKNPSIMRTDYLRYILSTRKGGEAKEGKKKDRNKHPHIV